MKLLRSGTPVATIFDLLGTKEDDMTFGLGFVISRSERFTRLLAEQVAGCPVGSCRDAVVQLQTSTADGTGRTDVEVHVPGRFVAVVEAKRGPELPSVGQLRKYVPVLLAVEAPHRFLVAVTNSPPDAARYQLPPDIDGIPVRHVTWRQVRQLALQSYDGESNHNKRLLDEFCDYLREILGMEKVRSNMVYVVSLSRGGEWGLHYMDVVHKAGRYFYPVRGGGWPEPPNYVAFRFDGRLQTVHHVEGFDVFTEPRSIFPEAKEGTVRPHYCLRLGPAIKPPKTTPNGPKIHRNARVWCMIDTLLTAETITAARDETKKRLGEM